MLLRSQHLTEATFTFAKPRPGGAEEGPQAGAAMPSGGSVASNSTFNTQQF